MITHEAPNTAPLPPGMYEGGFAHSAEAMQFAFASNGQEPPLTLYYPGSSTDVSLARIEGVRTIHADPQLGEEGLAGFQQLGSEAYAVDAETWHPPRPVDGIAFVNFGGNPVKTLEASQLRPGGIVVWAHWDGPPSALHDSDQVRLVSVINVDDEGVPSAHTEGLDDYFELKTFAELTEAEQRYFEDRWRSFAHARPDVDTGEATSEEIYEALKDPQNADLVFEANVHFPYKRTGAFFVFKKPDA